SPPFQPLSPKKIHLLALSSLPNFCQKGDRKTLLTPFLDPLLHPIFYPGATLTLALNQKYQLQLPQTLKLNLSSLPPPTSTPHPQHPSTPQPFYFPQILLALLQSPLPYQPQLALQFLTQNPLPACSPPLQLLSHPSNSPLQEALAIQLQTAPPSISIPLLLQLHLSPQPTVQLATLRSMAQNPYSPFLPYLLQSLSNPQFAANILPTLGYNPHPNAPKILYLVVQSQTPHIQQLALEILGRHPLPQTNLYLIQLLQSPDPYVRWKAHQFLQIRTGKSFYFYTNAPKPIREKSILLWKSWAKKFLNSSKKPKNYPPMEKRD
ncbi:MAG: hypothetical protein D6805_08500, partial [Planctomycetota bacterium]